MELLTVLADSSFAKWVQESDSLLAYPGFITLHTFGLAFLAGTSTATDLRILGIAPPIPLEKLFPVMWIAFWMSAVSGVVLFIPEATKWAFHPVFLVR